MTQIERDEEPANREENRGHESPEPNLAPADPHIGQHFEEQCKQHGDEHETGEQVGAAQHPGSNGQPILCQGHHRGERRRQHQ